MTLDNLARIGRLHPHQPTPDEIRRLLDAAARNLVDAANTTVSEGNRFTCAYTAIMQLAQAALFARGYRPATGEAGHHATMVQALVHSIDLSPERMRVLDALRRKRNVIDYEGEEPDPAEVTQAIEAATELRRAVLDWMAEHRPDLS